MFIRLEQLLEYGNLFSRNIFQVIIQSKQYHKRQEQACSREEMPNVVVIIEMKQFAVLVQLSRLGGRPRPRGRLVEKEIKGPEPSEG